MATDPQDLVGIALMGGPARRSQPMSHSDRSLSFSEVFQQYGSGILGLLRHLRVGEPDVEDVAQEVFLAVHVQLPTFQGLSTLKTWIYSIAIRKASDYRRKVQRRREAGDQALNERAQAPDQDSTVLRKQRVALLERALRTLPDKQLEVFVLYEFDELAMDEVAKVVGCPRFTAYSRLRAARKALQAYFERALEAGP